MVGFARRSKCQRYSNNGFIRCIIAYICMNFENFVLCFANIVVCFANLVLCFEKIVLCFINIV